MNDQVRRLALLTIFTLVFPFLLTAQDTLRITLSQAEQLFVQKNLALLAQRYNISIAQAEMIQARLRPNPSIQLTGSAYNPELNAPLNWSNRTGQYVFDVQQLVRLAGKRNKEIRLAETNIKVEEHAFYDLMRTLRFSLRSIFFDLYFLQQSIHAYQLQSIHLQQLDKNYEELQGKGLVTQKEALRIKSLSYAIKTELALLQNQASNLNADLQLMVQNNSVIIFPVVDILPDRNMITTHAIEALLDSAYRYRYDLKLEQARLTISTQSLSLAKAMAVPDITLGAEFDKRGSYVENATFLNAATTLPLFNRNQGNVKAAKERVTQSALSVQQKMLEVENEVMNAYLKVTNTGTTIDSFDTHFTDELTNLLQSITHNFQKKNVSLLEFIDFYQSYKETILQFNQLRNESIQAMEALHFAIGKPLFNQ